MQKKNSEEMVKEIAMYINSYNPDLDGFCKHMGNEHRTLQQSFTRLCLHWLDYLAETNNFDGRNEASVKRAKEIKEKLGDSFKYLPLV